MCLRAWGMLLFVWGLLSCPYVVMSEERTAKIGTLDYLDERFGFRDVRCESPPSALKGAKLVEIGIDTKYYRRQGEDLTIGDAHLQDVTYGFYDDHLYTIHITARGLINSHALLGTFSEAYGAPMMSNPYINKYVWLGERVKLLLEQKIGTDDANISFFCAEQLRKYEANQREKAHKAAGEL